MYLTRLFACSFLPKQCIIIANRKLTRSGTRFMSSISSQSDAVSADGPIRPHTLSGPSLKDFVAQLSDSKPYIVTNRSPVPPPTPYLTEESLRGDGRKVYIEVFGCQMNVNDTQLAQTILSEYGYEIITSPSRIKESDVHLLMTCSIRDGAEQKIWNRLRELSYHRHNQNGNRRQFGVLGCMAERLKTSLVEREKLVDVVCGPDAYRDLPKMLAVNHATGQSAVNVLLSLDETYEDVLPVNQVTVGPSQKTAFVSIMRGCDNFCSFCIVPFTRGRERSRPMASIEAEVTKLSEMGIREVTLLGQNVNSYRDDSMPLASSTAGLSRGFKTIYKPKHGGMTFDALLDRVAQVDGELRIRFTSPHPKDFPDEFLQVIKSHSNVCKSIHLPAQSGSNAVLKRMRRGYTRECYIDLVDHIRDQIPGVHLSTDLIAGFCGETEEDHAETIDLLERVKYNFVYAFNYSMREKTHAYHKFQDDVPEDVKRRRLDEIHSTFRRIALDLNRALIGTTQLILIEGRSRRSADQLQGRCDGNTKVLIPNVPIADLVPSNRDETSDRQQTNAPFEPQEPQVGQYVAVRITDATSQTLFGTPLFSCRLQDFMRHQRIFNRQVDSH